MNKTNISTAATTSVKNNIATFVVDNNGNVCERSQYKGSLRKDGKKYGICTRKYFDTVEDAEAQLNSEKELINNSSSVLFSTINKFIITKTDNTNKVLKTVNLKGSGFDYEEIKQKFREFGLTRERFLQALLRLTSLHSTFVSQEMVVTSIHSLVVYVLLW